MLRTYILSPHMNPVVTAFLLLVGYWLLRSILVISLWTHLIRKVGSMDQARQQSGSPRRTASWLEFLERKAAGQYSTVCELLSVDSY